MAHRVRSAVMLLLACASFSACPTGALVNPDDPATLVGEWSGAWTWPYSPSKAGGPYYLTIVRVEGRSVHGNVVARAPESARMIFTDEPIPWIGTLQGNRRSRIPRPLPGRERLTTSRTSS